MYLILNTTNRIVDIAVHAQYVRRQKNGIIAGCDEEKANAIYSTATNRFYPIKPIDFVSDGHTIVEVDEVPAEVVPGYYHYHAGEFYITGQDQEELEKPKPEQEIALLKEQNTALETQLTDTQIALCELYESVVM